MSVSVSSCFYWLYQLRRVRRSLDIESANTVVRAFIASRVNGCNAVLAESPKNITDRLQRVMNAAARVVNGTRKFDRGLTCLLHSELHWVDVPQQLQYKLGVMVYQCLQGMVPQYPIWPVCVYNVFNMTGHLCIISKKKYFYITCANIHLAFVGVHFIWHWIDHLLA